MSISIAKESTIKLLGRLLSSNGSRAKLVIFTYHRVFGRPDDMHPNGLSQDAFDAHSEILSRCFRVFTLKDAVNKLQEGSLPSRAACITFDDGYAENYDVVLPILRKWNLLATFFVTTGGIDGGILWNDMITETLRNTSKTSLDLTSMGLERLDLSTPRHKFAASKLITGALKYVPNEEREKQLSTLLKLTESSYRGNLMMTSSQVKRLHEANMEIGAHTVNHPILSRLSDDEATREILNSKAALQKIINDDVVSFAYPNGKPAKDYTETHVDCVRALGFKTAVSTHWGSAQGRSDFFQLPRIPNWILSRPNLGLRLFQVYW